jgi:hypothetical protein
MRQSKICNCHNSSNKDILKTGCNQSFCDKCGCFLLKDSEGNIYYTLKTKQNRLPYELSPITIIKNMKKKTEEEYPFIYQEFNVNKSDKVIREKSLKSLNIYLRHRKMLILKLQKIIKIFDYCDLIFYQCLFYLDTYLSHYMTEDISEKKILYYLVGFFLCSVKSRENDIYEPLLDSFYDLKRGIYLSTDTIAYYEVLCLKKIHYNIFSYSAYDWLTQLVSNGVVFNCEINKENEVILIRGHRHSVINAINKYAIKLLLDLTSKCIFFKYAPMYTAISLIQIAREKYINKAMIKPKLFYNLIKIYGINPNDYTRCYEEIKREINENSNSEKDNNNRIKEEKQDLNIENDDSDKIERTESTKNSTFNKHKNVYVPNKIKSSNVIVRINDNHDKNSIRKNNNEVENSKEIEIEKSNEDKEFELSLNEIKSKDKKSKNKKQNFPSMKTVNHLSIDCSSNFYPSNDNLPYMNPISKDRNSFLTINENKEENSRSKNLSLSKKKNRPDLKELKHLRHDQNNRYNSIESKNISTNPNSHLSSITKEKEKETGKKKSKFFSNKNINLNFNADNTDINEITKKSKLTSKILPKISGFEGFNMEENNRNKNKYRLKTNIKVTLPEDEMKQINDSKKMIKVL